MLTTRPRGTNDILPEEIGKWYALEETLRSVAAAYGFKEIRTPIFEHTELFQRGVGESTDIVEKEMYTFTDRGERSITLRPEATASTVRAFVENKLYTGPQPTKLFYLGPMFRYDRPQAGRYRQFHQFGVEVFGTNDPGVDAEVIAMAMEIYNRLGLVGLTVELNSVGCPACRRVYHRNLQAFLESHRAKLCRVCQERLDKNPLRVLDCKNPECQEITKEAPLITADLCGVCAEHFIKVRQYLTAFEVDFHLDPRLVRGLDYYNQTAFEIVVHGIGAQASIGGGGRYNGLIEQCGGPDLPGIGYALGMERILLALEQQKLSLPTDSAIDAYVATLGDKARFSGAALTQRLRQKGLVAERDYLNKSLKAQLKAADRLNARYTVILGEDELENKKAVVRKMGESSQTVIPLAELEEYLLKETR